VTQTLRATVARAEPTHSEKPTPAGRIEITEQVPEFPATAGWEAVCRTYYAGEAARIHDVLSKTLPGGTLDALFALMAADRASLFRVPAHSPRRSTPDVVLAVDGPIADDDGATVDAGEPCEVCGRSPATRCRVEPNDPTDPGVMTLCAACAIDCDAEGVTR